MRLGVFFASCFLVWFLPACGMTGQFVNTETTTSYTDVETGKKVSIKETGSGFVSEYDRILGKYADSKKLLAEARMKEAEAQMKAVSAQDQFVQAQAQALAEGKEVNSQAVTCVGNACTGTATGQMPSVVQAASINNQLNSMGSMGGFGWQGAMREGSEWARQRRAGLPLSSADPEAGGSAANSSSPVPTSGHQPRVVEGSAGGQVDPEEFRQLENKVQILMEGFPEISQGIKEISGREE